MGTRQLRISDPAILKARIKSLTGMNITVILTNNTTTFGELNAVSNVDLVIKNMRRKAMKYSLAEISEVYVDTKA